MERLIADAEKLDSTFKASRDKNGKYAMSFNDIIDAIEIVEEKQQILGTTANEATKTISGSFGSLKAAWENLVTGFADPDADLGELINNVVTTASTALKNAVPTIVRSLGGIATAIKELVPIIGQELPGLISEVLPQLLEAASSLVQSLAGALPGLIDVLAKELPPVLNTLIPVAIEALTTVFDAISKALPDILKVIEDNIEVVAGGIFTIMSSIGQMLIEALPLLAEMTVKWLPKALEFIKKNLNSVKSAISTVIKTLGQLIMKLAPVIFPMLMEIGVDLIKSMAEGIKNNADEVIKNVLTIVNLLIDTLLEPTTLISIIQAVVEIIVAVSQALLDNIDLLTQALLKVVGYLIVALVGAAPDILEGATTAFLNICTAIGNIVGSVLEAIGGLLGDVLGADGIGGWGADIIEKCVEVFGKIGSGISDAWDTITGAVKEFGENIWNGIKDGLGNLFEKGKEIVMDIVDGIKSVAYKINEAIWGEGAGSKAIEKANKKAQEQGYSSANAYFEGQKKGYDVHSPSKKMKWLGEMVMAGFNDGLEDEAETAADPFEKINKKAMGIGDPTSAFGVQSKVGGTNEVQTSRINDLIDLMRVYMNQGQEIVIPVYVAGRQIDEILVSGKNRITTRSGGQVDV